MHTCIQSDKHTGLVSFDRWIYPFVNACAYYVTSSLYVYSSIIATVSTPRDNPLFVQRGGPGSDRRAGDNRFIKSSGSNYTLSEHYSHFRVYNWLAMKFK